MNIIVNSIGLLNLTLIIHIILKFTGIINWNWSIVLWPLWAIFIITIIVIIILKYNINKENKKIY